MKDVDNVADIESKVLVIVRDLLFNEKIVADTDLFEAGLNSIVATQMVARIHASTGVSVALHEVFETTNSESFTVKALVRTFETASAKESDKIQIISKRELYDVSYVQRRLWLLEKLNGGRFPSSIPLQIIFREALDITAIEKSLDTLLLRHPSFHTEYIETEDGLFQKIADVDNCKFRITVEDIGGEEDIESILKDIGRQEAKHIFELSGDLLLNFRLVRISPDHFRAFITFHHIATDGWSASIVLREFFHLYDCFTKGLPNSLVPVQIQYTDYAVWLNSQIDQRISGDRNYWISNISGLTERTHLPNYNKRPSVKSYEGKRLSFKFPELIVSTLLKICSEENCTLFTALTATLNVLFHRYNSIQSVVLGTSVSNRGFGGSENLVGYFLSVLALRTEVSADHTFSEILAATRTTIQQAYKHQHYPFDQIVNDLQLQRDSRYNPIFDVIVLLHNYENPIVPDSAQFDSRESRIVLETDNETCITDVFLEFFQAPNQLVLNVRYDVNLYDDQQIHLFYEHFCNLVEKVGEQKDQPIHSLNFLTDEEKQNFSQPGSHPDDKSVLSEIIANSQRSPRRTAISWKGEKITYQELISRASAIAAAFHSVHSDLEGRIICVSLDRSPDLIASILAIWKVGAIYVPIDPSTPELRSLRILQDTCCSILVSQTGSTVSSQSNVSVITLHDLPDAVTDIRFLTANDPSHAAYIIYTSGSTGVPKGAIVAHRGMMNHIEAKLADLKINESSIIAQNASISFDISIWQMMAALVRGASVHIVDQGTILEPGKFLREVTNVGVTHLEVVPSYLSALLDHAEYQSQLFFTNLHFMIATGEALVQNLVARWFSCYPSIPMVNAYGPTEASDDVTHHFLYSPSQPIHIGRPIQNTRIYILGSNMSLCPTGTVGELYVAGSGVGLGYLNDPEKTHASFIADPLHTSTTRLYKTGDLGRYKPGGEIEFIGRTDNQIKLFGHRIELGEIEDKLSMLTGASQLAVLLLDGPDQNRYLVAYFQAHEKVSVESLKEDLRKFLPEYMVPALIVQLEKMPLTSNGKIDKKQLQRMEVDAADEFKTEILDNTESIVLSIWKDVLKRSDLTSKQNFFQVGGNSLLANLVAIRLNKELHTNVQLYDLFTHTNVRELATLVGKLGNTEACKIKPVEDQEYYAPSHSQRRMWILQHLKNDQTAFNVNGAYRLSGHVDVELFQKAVGSVIAQHQAIRTVFPIVLGEPVQMVKENWDLASLIDVVNCVHVRDTDRDDYIGREIISFSSIPFDLSRDVPIRIRILAFGNDDAAIVFVLHHIASDGWSKQLIEQQIFIAYSKMLKGNWNNSSSKELQFRDYSSWQNNLLGEDKLHEHRLYWKNKLSSHTPEPFDFPFQHERPATRNYAGASIDVDLPAEVSGKLRQYCEKKGVTLFVVFVSIVQLVFHKLSGKDKLTVGVALAGRNHDDLLKLAGFFVNALPLTTTIGQGTTFNNMVGQVNKLVVEMLSHESYPFDVLVDELDIRREQGRNAMFDILLEVHQFETIRNSIDADLSRDSAFNVKEIKIPETSSINDMNLVLNERDGHLTLHVRFDTQLFTNEAVMRLAGYMLSVTNELVGNESLHIDQLEQLRDETRTDYESHPVIDHTAVDIFLQQVTNTPEKIALRSEDNASTYREVNIQVNRLAKFFAQVPSNNPITGILMDRSIDMIESILALWSGAKAYLPLDGQTPIQRLEYIVNDASIEFLIFSKKYLREAHHLLWACESLKNVFCIDSFDITAEVERSNESMRRELWEYVGESSIDDITGGGWINSYTSRPFTQAEMDEYADNTLTKLKPYLRDDSRVLEIGCASGISMFRIAPLVKHYTSTDLSRVIIEKNRKRVAEEQLSNITLHTLYAHEIDQIEGDFDVIVINSVIQNFHGYNYLLDVIAKSIARLAPNGILFIGDVMDLGQKKNMIDSLESFRKQTGGIFATKLDWSEELFVSREFFNNLQYQFNGISRVTISNKVYTIENELTDFRFDVVIEVNKSIHKQSHGAGIKRVWDQRALADIAPDNNFNLSTPDDIAYIIYTSGSTGQPKGVVIEHRGMLNHLYAKISELSLDNESVIVQNASHCFDISVWQFFAALMVGGTTVVIDNETVAVAENFMTELERHAVDIAEVVPSYLAELLVITERSGVTAWTSHLKYMVVTGEVLHHGLVKRWFRAFPHIELLNAYGPTEASDDVTHHKMRDVPASATIPIGKPLPGIFIDVIDSKGQRCVAGTSGEVLVRGISVGRGYLNNPERTALSFDGLDLSPEQRSYRTGDIGSFNPDGTLTFSGRNDHQIKVRGHRIELGEIEQKVFAISGVKETVVLADDPLQATVLHAFIACDGESQSNLTDATFKKELAKSLPSYMVPDVFHFYRVLPKSISGKIDRKTLSMSMNEKETSAFTTNDEITAKIASMWAEILNRRVTSIHENFFEAGGHSLKATRLLSRIHRDLDVKIELRDIFLNPVFQDIVDIVKKAGQVNSHRRIPRASYSAHYELSNAQKRLWVLSQFDGGLQAYSEEGAVRFERAVDPVLLQRAVNQLIERHEILRTSFVVIDGEPRQKINRFQNELYKIQLCEFGEKAFHAEDLLTILSTAGGPFDLTKCPLIRFALADTHTNGWVFAFSVHHIICDGWSGRVFLRDIISLYLDYERGVGTSLRKLAIQFKDYAVWQKKLLRDSQTEVSRQFWAKKLGKTLPRLDLPTFGARHAVFSYRGDTVVHGLDPGLAAKLRTLSSNHDTTLFTTLTSVLNLLFYRYTGQHDIVLGTTVSGRSHIDLEDQIGFYINTVVLRNSFEPSITFLSLLELVKRNTFDAFQHQDYPFDLLVEDLAIKRELSRSAIFDVLVEFQSFDEIVQSSSDTHTASHKLTAQPINVRKTNSQMDMNWSFHEVGDALSLVLVFNTDLYDHKLINQYISHFELLCNEVTKDPGQRLFRYSIISAEQVKSIVNHNNNIAHFPLASIVTAFENIVDLYPGKVAVKCGNTLLTYRALDEYANKIANFLLSKDVKKESLICVVLDRDASYVGVMMGVFKSGCAYLPIDPDAGANRIAKILNDSAAAYLITSANLLTDELFARVVVESSIETILNVSLVSYEVRDSNKVKNFTQRDLTLSHRPKVQIASTDLAYVIYTSGSTGQPKGALIEHSGMLNHLHVKINELLIDGSSVVAQNASQSFDISIWQFLSALMKGGTTVVYPTTAVLDIHGFVNDLANDHVSILELVPAYIGVFLDTVGSASVQLSELKVILATGETLKANIARRVRQIFPSVRIINAYGPTEASDDITHYEVKEILGHSIPIGTVLSNMEIFIVDQHMNLCPPYVKGELCVAGVGVGRGYLNDVEKTDLVFVENPFPTRYASRLYKTGDIASWNEDGVIEFFGRRDSQVKMRGHRIELGEIEAALLSIAYIDDAIASAIEGHDQQKRIHVFVVAGRFNGTTDDIRRNLKALLPEYMIPASISLHEKFPLNVNGKIDMNALLSQEIAFTGDETFVAPQSGSEMLLAKAWEQLFPGQLIGIHSDFFQLGGDSIKAIQLISILHKAGCQVHVNDVFQYPSIDQLKEHLTTDLKIDQNAITGEIPMGISQRLFFETHEHDHLQYNLAVVLNLKQRVDPKALRRIFTALCRHHDMLRCVFPVMDGRRIQYCLPPSEFPEIEERSWRSVMQGDADFDKFISVQQGSFDLTNGPLIRPVLLMDGNKQSLLIIVHHLVFDGVSWRILLEDISTLISQLPDCQPDALGLKTHSYPYWVENALKGTNGKRSTKAVSYLDEMERRMSTAGRIKRDVDEGTNRVSDSALVDFTLSLTDTQSIRSASKARSGGSFSELLLTAIHGAFCKTFRLSNAAIVLEGHGRASSASMNISRTIGWFSDEYPVLFEYATARDWALQLEHVKETLSAVPNDLLYDLRDPNAAIRFNYMGNLSGEIDNDVFTLLPDAVPSLHGKSMQREYDFEVSAIIMNNILTVSVSFNKNYYRRPTIESLVDEMKKNIEEIMSYEDSLATDVFDPVDRITNEDVEQIKSMF